MQLKSEVNIDISRFDEDDYLQLTQDNLDYLKRMFETGQTDSEKVKTNFVWTKNHELSFQLL